MNDFNFKHDDDCDCLDSCNSIGSTYNKCYAGASKGSRCSPAEKNQLLALNTIIEQLKLLNSKK